MSNTRRPKRQRPPKRVLVHDDGQTALLTDPKGRAVGVIRSSDLGPGKSVDLAKVQPPGLNGDYSGTCVACMRPCDTALAIGGPAEAHAAALMAWGVPYESAVATVREAAEDLGQDLSGDYITPTRVCADCAGKAHMTPVLAISGSLPLYQPPPGALT
jgi:hypothetical protein